MRDHDDCAIAWHFIGVPDKFRIHNIISDKPVDFINPTSAAMLVGVGTAGAKRISYLGLFASCGLPATQIAQRRVR